MEKFADKFTPLDTTGTVYKTISKQLRRNGITTKKNWFKNIRILSIFDTQNERILILNLYNTETKQFYSTCSICHNIDSFDVSVGLKICASRMAAHTDFVESIRTTDMTLPALLALDFIDSVRKSYIG
jgi:hypothetical protein